MCLLLFLSIDIDNRATTPVDYCPSTASFSVRPYCKNARRDRCQEYHNCFPFGGLEEIARTSSNYVDEDYPARPEIKQSLTGWADNCGSESSTLETDVCVWRYALLLVHATQEEEEEDWHWWCFYNCLIAHCKFSTDTFQLSVCLSIHGDNHTLHHSWDSSTGYLSAVELTLSWQC